MKEFEQKNLVQFIDFPKEIDEFEKTKANSSAQNVFEKIRRISKNETTLLIHVKQHAVDAKKHKFSVHARANWPGHFFEASHVEWDFLSATQAALDALLHEVKKNHEKESKRRR